MIYHILQCLFYILSARLFQYFCRIIRKANLSDEWTLNQRTARNGQTGEMINQCCKNLRAEVRIETMNCTTVSSE